jgi:hypothetical protein
MTVSSWSASGLGYVSAVEQAVVVDVVVWARGRLR